MTTVGEGRRRGDRPVPSPGRNASVGGNADAKLALEDALALDPEKRRLLSTFGMRAPTGVLLYG